MKNQIKKVSLINWVSSSWIIYLVCLTPTRLPAVVIQKFEKNVKTQYAVKVLAEKISRKTVEEQLRDFVKNSRPSRISGSSGHTKARDYIEKKIKDKAINGASFLKEEFKADNGQNGVNFIWEKKGIQSPDEVMILIANYDTYGPQNEKNKNQIIEMPGADNNASGVALLLSMMELFAELDMPKTIKLVFLDLEGPSAFGSQEFAKRLMSSIGNQKIAGVLNLFMLAHDTKINDSEKKFNNFKIYYKNSDKTLASLISEKSHKLYGSFEFKEFEVEAQRDSNDKFPPTLQSFWSLGLPAVTLSENRETDLNPRYNTSNDFVETLNFNTYLLVFRALTGTVLSWNYGIVK